MNDSLPSIDIIMPTLNAASILPSCLAAIRMQDYPAAKVRIIVADGGSTDDTRKIAQNFGATVCDNPLKTGEAGKAAALRQSHADLVAMVDSDNLLPDRNWLKKIVAPFADPDIIGSEPIRFTYRRPDGLITRYSALIGMNDPLCLFLGNYDKESLITGRWTNLSLREQKEDGYRKVWLKAGRLPTIGANGTVFRRRILEPLQNDPYLFDIDILAHAVAQQPPAIAKVDVGIIHLYGGSDVRLFVRKQHRRVQDFLFHRAQKVRKYTWSQRSYAGYLYFIVSCVLIVPLFWQAYKGYRRRPDRAWWFHPVACWITLLVYATGTLQGIRKPRLATRKRWQQVASS